MPRAEYTANRTARIVQVWYQISTLISINPLPNQDRPSKALSLPSSNSPTLERIQVRSPCYFRNAPILVYQNPSSPHELDSYRFHQITASQRCAYVSIHIPSPNDPSLPSPPFPATESILIPVQLPTIPQSRILALVLQHPGARTIQAAKLPTAKTTIREIQSMVRRGWDIMAMRSAEVAVAVGVGVDVVEGVDSWSESGGARARRGMRPGAIVRPRGCRCSCSRNWVSGSLGSSKSDVFGHL